MKSSLWFLVGLLLIGGVNAQTACSPGMVPYGVGVCGYDNSQQQPIAQVPGRRTPPLPPQWANRWGAIATDSVIGSLGTATERTSQSEAERTAMENCAAKGGTQCKLQIWYKNGCAAMIVGNKEFNVQSAATTEKAIQLGMKICASDADTNCHVYYTACSLPVRIR